MFAMLFKYFAFMPVGFVANILAKILAPVATVFSFYTEDGNLPRCFYWMQTHDAHLDAGWKDGYYGERGVVKSTFDKYVKRVRWIWRNTAYSFRAAQLGILNGNTKELVKKGNYTPELGGWRLVVTENRFKQLAFLFQCRYKSPLSTAAKTRKIQMYVGWGVTRQDEPTSMYEGFGLQVSTSWDNYTGK